MKKISALLFFMIIQATNALAFKELDLMVGENKLLEIGSFAAVEVSRKGYVEITKDSSSSTKWKLVGLRSGFVIISFYAQSTDKEPSEKIYLTVLKDERKNKNPEMQAFCRINGVICDADEFHIKGSLDDPTIFFKIKSYCEKKQSCLFFAHLNEKGKESLKKEIGDFFQDKAIDIHIQDDGGIFLRSYLFCEKKIDKNIHVNHLEKAYPHISFISSCEPSKSPYYQIRGKVFLMNNSLVKSLGFKNHFSYSNQRSLELNTILESLEKEHRIQILAEPSFNVLESSQGSLHSGGEIPFYDEDDDNDKNTKNRVKWKQTGIKMDAFIKKWVSNTVMLDYKFFLKAQKEDGSLFSHEFMSQIKLSLSEPKIVAFAEIQQEGRGAIGSIFKYIPIIGPLFKKDEEDGNNVHIFLWMEVKQLD